ncbi:hypothetical protein M422DRAFT_276914, partial [Sphaerobolus stellatus SS14]
MFHGSFLVLISHGVGSYSSGSALKGGGTTYGRMFDGRWTWLGLFGGCDKGIPRLWREETPPRRRFVHNEPATQPPVSKLILIRRDFADTLLNLEDCNWSVLRRSTSTASTWRGMLRWSIVSSQLSPTVENTTSILRDLKKISDGALVTAAGELEKADRDVAMVVLQILDEGSLTDSQGCKVDFE